MKIIVETFKKTTPKEIIERRMNEYLKKGVDIKAEIVGDVIRLYYMDEP